MRLHGLLRGGKYVFMCKACGKLGGSGGPPGNFDFAPLNREFSAYPRGDKPKPTGAPLKGTLIYGCSARTARLLRHFVTVNGLGYRTGVG